MNFEWLMYRAAREPKKFPSASDGLSGSKTHHLSPKPGLSSVCPIQRIVAEPHPAAERGMRPILRTDRVTVLDRVEMEVNEVPRKIVLLAQRMLPYLRAKSRALL